MPSAHGVSVSGSLSAPGAFGDAIARQGRRAVAQRLRRGGEDTARIAASIAASELGKWDSQRGKRRNKGASYRNGFAVTYTGLVEFGNGNMVVTVRNRARHARIIEYGSAPHEIAPTDAESLSWPGMVSKDWPDIETLPKGRAVEHPGTKPYHIGKRAAALGIERTLTGVVAHAVVVFSTRAR